MSAFKALVILDWYTYVLPIYMQYILTTIIFPDVQTFRASIGEYSMKVFVHIIYTANPFVTADSPK